MNYLLIISITFAAIFTALVYLFAFTSFIYKRQLKGLEVSFQTVDSANKVINQSLELQKQIVEQQDRLNKLIEILEHQEKEIERLKDELELPY